MRESHGLQMCGVFDEKVKSRTLSIVCIWYQSYAHFKCAGLYFREAKESKGKFNCSKCLVSEIQHAVNYKRLKKKIKKCVHFVDWFCFETLCDAHKLRSERLVYPCLICYKIDFSILLKAKLRDWDNNLGWLKTKHIIYLKLP